jgi:hypothetical protein
MSYFLTFLHSPISSQNIAKIYLATTSVMTNHKKIPADRSARINHYEKQGIKPTG